MFDGENTGSTSGRLVFYLLKFNITSASSSPSPSPSLRTSASRPISTASVAVAGVVASFFRRTSWFSVIFSHVDILIMVG